MLGFLAKVMLVTSLVLIPLSVWHRSELPPAAKMLPALDSDPRQTATSARPFDIGARGLHYTITPRFAYDLSGMVVSTHDAASSSDTFHGEMKDYVNVVDLCVVWGSTAREEIYKEYSFSNNDTFCFGAPKSEKSRAIDIPTMSNNHLVTNSPTLAAELRKVRPGDQVRFAGYLISYSRQIENNGTISRNTSTVRTDTGDGACEVVYVNEFEILRPYQNQWETGLKAGVGLLVLSLLTLIYAYGREKI